MEFEEVNKVVDEIISEVKKRKDDAVREYTLKFDGVYPEDLRVSQKELDDAFRT